MRLLTVSLHRPLPSSFSLQEPDNWIHRPAFDSSGIGWKTWANSSKPTSFTQMAYLQSNSYSLYNWNLLQPMVLIKPIGSLSPFGARQDNNNIYIYFQMWLNWPKFCKTFDLRKNFRMVGLAQRQLLSLLTLNKQFFWRIFELHVVFIWHFNFKPVHRFESWGVGKWDLISG